MVLTGLPILSLTQFLGGVDPDLVLAGFAATALTMFGLAGVSTLCSVYSRKARTAIILAYALIAIYFTSSGLVLAILSAYPKAADFPLTLGVSTFTPRDIADALNAGNPFTALFKLGEALSGGGSLADALPAVLRNYAIFHATLGVASATWAIVRLRAIFLRETYGVSTSRTRRGGTFFRRHRPACQQSADRLEGSVCGVRLEPQLVRPNYHRSSGRGQLRPHHLDGAGPVLLPHREFRVQLEYGTCASSEAMVACLTLIGIAIRASSSVSSERDRQTWDSLLTTPSGRNEILYGKWIGSILSVRWAALWIGLIWLIGLVTDGLSIIAVPFLIGAFLVFAAFIGILGLWFSIVSRTTFRANIGTLGTTVLLGGGYWFFFALCCFGLLFNVGPGRGIADEMAKFMSVGMTPPVTLGVLAFTNDQIRLGQEDFQMLSFALIGLVVWALATASLWAVTSARFRAVTGRVNSTTPRRCSLAMPRPRCYTDPATTIGGAGKSGRVPCFRGTRGIWGLVAIPREHVRQ